MPLNIHFMPNRANSNNCPIIVIIDISSESTYLNIQVQYCIKKTLNINEMPFDDKIVSYAKEFCNSIML
jgi:hypothetical protein